MPLDYLSCFATVLIRIHGKVDISQTDYSICFKLRILPYSGGKFNKRLKQKVNSMKGLQILKKPDVFVFSFSLFQCPTE